MSIYTPPATNAVDFALTVTTPPDMTPYEVAMTSYTPPALSAVDLALTTITVPDFPYVGWELLPAAPSSIIGIWGRTVGMGFAA